MKKKATRNSAAAKKQAAPKKQAAKKAPKKKAAKKKAPAKKAANKKTTQKKTTQKNKPVKKSTAKSKAAKKPARKNKPDQTGADQHPLQGKSTVFASARTNEWQPFPLLRIIESDELLKEKSARKDELDAQYKKAEKAYELLSKELKKQKREMSKNKGKSRTQPKPYYGEVTGMEIGFRTKYGQFVSPLQYVITVNVSQKKSEGDLKKRKIDPLPASINETPIKVLEGSFEKAAPIDQGNLAIGLGSVSTPAREDPIFGGQPVAERGHIDNFGTLGFVFQTIDEKKYGLTNTHVTSKNTVRLISSGTGSQEVGNVGLAVEKHSSLGRYVDASYFSLEHLEVEGIDALPYQIQDINREDPSLEVFISSKHVDNHFEGISVYKYGARSGKLKEGLITSAFAEVEIDGDPKKGVFKVKNFSNTFLQPGDSGSLILMKTEIDTKPAWLVLGILFAQLKDNDRVAYVCHISEVIKLLKLEIPERKLVP